MAGHRLRVIRLVPMPAVGYGSDNYGDWTYGTRQSDAADLQRYEIVPTTASATEYPLMWRRAGDTAPPFECFLVAYASEYENVERSGVTMDLSGVLKVIMRLKALSTPLDAPQYIDLPMSVVDNIRLQRIFAADDFPPGGGTYRMTIKVAFNTGRQLTLPIDDHHTVIVQPNPQTAMT
jgi:hypothetical protein